MSGVALTRRSLLEGKTIERVWLERVKADDEHGRPGFVAITRLVFTDGTALSLYAEETEFAPRVVGTVFKPEGSR